MRRLVVDDMRVFPLDCVYARTLQEGFDLIETAELGDELWLDHDLGYEQTTNPAGSLNKETIRPLVSTIEERAFLADNKWSAPPPYPFSRIMIVTSNPPGRDWIRKALEPYYTVDVYNGPCQYTE